MKCGPAIFLLTSLVLSGCHKAAPFPAHIEAPDYETISQLAHITGQVRIQATVDRLGNVVDAQADGPPLLAKGALENIRRWKFQTSGSSSTKVTVVYEYRLEGEGNCYPMPPLVSFDLPGRVEIVARPTHTCDPSVPIQNQGKQ
jgi:hypothetical protein